MVVRRPNTLRRGLIFLRLLSRLNCRGVKTVFEAYKKLLHANNEFTQLQAARVIMEYRLSGV